MAFRPGMGTTPPAVLQLLSNLNALSTHMCISSGNFQSFQHFEHLTAARVQTMVEHTQHMQQICEAVREDVAVVGRDGTRRWMAQDAPAAADLHTASKRCAAAFGGLITAAVAAMQRVEAAVSRIEQSAQAFSSSPAVRVFWSMWHTLLATCKWFSSWAPFRYSPVPIDLTTLLPVLNTFTAHLLTFTRSSSATHNLLWSVLEEESVGRHTLFVFTDASILLLSVISALGPSEMCRAFNHLPPGFIATLCCLACEADPTHRTAGGEIRPIQESIMVKYRYTIRTLEEVMCNCVMCHETVGPSVAINPELFSSAAVELVKRAVSLHHNTPSKLGDILAAQHTLFILLTTGQMLLSTKPGNGLNRPPPQTRASIFATTTTTTTSTGGTGSSSSISIKDLDPSRTTSEGSLLSLYLACSLKHPGSLYSCSRLMLVMASEWQDPETGRTKPKAIRFLPAVLRHCSQHFLQLMQQQQQQPRQQRTQLLQWQQHQRDWSAGEEPISPSCQQSVDSLQKVMLRAMGLYISELRASDGESRV